MLYHDYPGQECSIAAALEVVGERWSLLIIRDVLRGERRFDRIQASLGIARNVLAKRLNRLVEAGILDKRAYQTSPERFEYFLTEKGQGLWPVLMTLVEWGDRYCDSGTGRILRIVHRDCGGEVDGRRVCQECGAQLEVDDVESVPAPSVGLPPSTDRPA